MDFAQSYIRTPMCSVTDLEEMRINTYVRKAKEQQYSSLRRSDKRPFLRKKARQNFSQRACATCRFLFCEPIESR